MKTKIIAAVLLVLICVYIQPATIAEANQTVGFSVRAVHSEKQIKSNVSFFDLLLSPGEEHVLEVDIFNNSDSPISTSISATTAGTNSGGVIDYDNINVSDESLKVSFYEIAKIEESLIYIPETESVRAKITFTMPDEPFDGIMLGGIVIKKIEEDINISGNETGTSIQNEYCYVIGVRVRVNDSVAEPDFRLRYVEPKLQNYHTSIAANLQNFEAALVKGAEIEANVYYNNEEQPLYYSSNDDFDIAPNSNFDYIIPCSSKLPVGDYRLLLTLTHNDRIWEFDESFTISEAAANDINDKAVNVPATNYYIVAIIGLSVFLFIALIIIIIFMIISRRKKKDEKRNQ